MKDDYFFFFSSHIYSHTLVGLANKYVYEYEYVLLSMWFWVVRVKFDARATNVLSNLLLNIGSDGGVTTN